MTFTSFVDAGGIPDEFSFAILDGTGVEIPTLGPADSLASIDLLSDGPLVSVYAGDGNRPPVGGGPVIALNAPSASSPVPEPKSIGLALVGLTVIAASRRPRRP